MENEGGAKRSFRFWILMSVFFVVILGSIFFIFSYFEKRSLNQVYPGIFLGDFPIGGMNQEELETFLQNMDQKLSSEGVSFILKNKDQEKKFTFFGPNPNEISSQDLVSFDQKKEAERLIQLGKSGNVFSRIFRYFEYSFSHTSVALKNVNINEVEIQKFFEEKTSGESILTRNADIVVQSVDPLKIETVPSQIGFFYDFALAKKQMLLAWSRLSTPEVTLVAQNKIPDITDDEVVSLSQNVQVEQLFNKLPLTFVAEIEGEDPKSWNVTKSTFQSWVGANEFEGGIVGFGVKDEEVKKYFSTFVAPSLESEPEDARFRVSSDGKVEEFQESKLGRSIDVDRIISMLNQFMHDGLDSNVSVTSTFTIPLLITEPQIKTSDVNNLGITHILGVGISNFKGSPANRVHNIQSALKKLNGILIKPGEEFSAIRFTEPYTLESGYLPEKVIKGDKITPEIGGGLCQIGTTLFRMAMNSGLEITERRNHSLVVSYYNDPSNNLPGTDATIYDPSPDFKFKNDTANYVLIQASANVETGELKFVLWGSKDGRKGSYSKPVVSRWISPGEPKIIETENLPPGVKECQNAFRGANASFTYTRVLPDGTEEKTLFESYYRPLPQICLIGKDPNAVMNPPAVDSGQPLVPALEPPVVFPVN